MSITIDEKNILRDSVNVLKSLSNLEISEGERKEVDDSYQILMNFINNQPTE